MLGLPGDALAHARCNVRDGAKLGASITNGKTVTAAKTVTVRPSRVW